VAQQETAAPGSWLLALGSWLLAFGFWLLAFGTQALDEEGNKWK
jgi:hypothetical protein